MIEFRDVSVQAGAFALEGIAFTVPEHGWAVLTGRTGTGKTTIVETLCGLRRPTRGSVHLHGVDVTPWAPGRRDIGYVPQDGALFPTLTVHEHLAFALRLRREREAAIEARVQQLAAQLEIEALLERRPYGLSGGERQRVALGRALAHEPSILCLDEPLSMLDEATHDEMMALLRTVRETHRVTVLHVTHSMRECRVLGDVHLELTEGKIERAQKETPGS
ncbi:MAG: ATP-binding cassette domain-containing protein [Planctomycetes bacterium]|nr:ATP-binding cassette domain-containing protein [Planctomycetota bacterium]MCB9891735.1 ATP-binding cassette domain-containing protein [Planctomycetota bacterium]